MQKEIFYIAIAPLVVFMNQPSHAAIQTNESISEIEMQAKAFVENNLHNPMNGRLSINIGQIDERLKLPKCDTPLQIGSSDNSLTFKTTSLSVRCVGKQSWKIYIPTEIALFVPVVTARQHINKGDNLDVNNLEITEQNIAKTSFGYYDDVEAVENLIAKMTLSAGQIISQDKVMMPRAIKRGDRVNIIAKAGAIKITAQGIALSDGIKGDEIAVKNQDSQRVIKAIVAGPSEVMVRL